MEPFLIAFAAIFLAEMGDKTQLVALAFAARFRPWVVVAGVAAATLLVHLLSVALGEALGVALPRQWVAALAGLAFLGFGVWTLRGDTLDDEPGAAQGPRFGPFMTVAVAFFLAELGDKTMLATVTLAGQLRDAIPVWLGSTGGMVAADGLAIAVGALAGAHVPERAVKLVAGALFLASGVWLLASAATG